LLVFWAWPQLKTDVCVGRQALLAALLVACALSARADPEKNYLLHCSGCHLPNGIGDPPNTPSLRGTIGKIVATPEGRDYIIRVPGSSQTPMSDEQLAAVLNWMLTEFNSSTLPENFKPLSAKEVSKSRSLVLADPLKYRAQFWPDY
jgi:mono/diheme cytochrome c family protein